jgi:hypothetical protein
MCFSASASFVAGTALLAVGVATLRQARRPAELPFAAVPLLFGVQQGVEGALWLGLRADTALLNTALTQIYSFFSHVLWPVYVPLAVLLLEPAAGRRKVLGSLLALGAGTALYLLYTLVRFPITADATGGHIRYLAPHFYVAWVMAAYLTATCASLLVSSHRAVVAFGVLALAAVLAAYLAYAAWFISVWCFFAAVLSAVVWLHFRHGRPATVGPLLDKSSPSAG